MNCVRRRFGFVIWTSHNGCLLRFSTCATGEEFTWRLMIANSSKSSVVEIIQCKLDCCIYRTNNNYDHRYWNDIFDWVPTENTRNLPLPTSL